MLVLCPGCRKKLNVPENLAGKKLRCPGCKTVVPAPAASAAVTPSPPREGPRQSPARPDEAAASKPRSTMRCAACEEAALEALPANQFSRRPGYVCTECGTTMRQPGSTGALVLVTVLGGFVILMGLALAFFVVTADSFRARSLTGAIALAGLGFSVGVWAVNQLRLPTPLDAPPRPSRLGFWVAMILLAVLVVGGGLFFFAYYVHEMM
jgi:hypothetical protein